MTLYSLEDGQYVCHSGSAFFSPAIDFRLDVEAFYDEVEDHLENS